MIAGPGTGKTKTLVSRIAYLIQNRGVKPSEITAVTFTNKAAGEMRERLEKQLGGKCAVRAMTIGTFHAICLQLLTEHTQGVNLLDEYEAREIADEIGKAHACKLSPQPFCKRSPPEKRVGTIGKRALFRGIRRISECLHTANVLDFDDLLLQAVAMAEAETEKTPNGPNGSTIFSWTSFKTSTPCNSGWCRRGTETEKACL